MNEITVIVGRLENQKQLKPITDHQRTELVELLYKLNESKERIQRRADSVRIKETYGTIAYQYWVEDLICTESEIAERLYQMRRSCKRKISDFENSVRLEIDKQILKYRQGEHVDEKIIEREAERIAYERHRQIVRQSLERKAQQLTRRMKQARRVLLALGLDSRRKILLEAIRRGIMKEYDELMVAEIQSLAGDLYKITEDVSFMHSVAS